MPVNGATFDPPPRRASTATGATCSATREWFDAHTHIGQNDPDGRKATAEEIIGGLDARRPPARAASSPCTSPTATAAANDAVLAASRGVGRPARAARARQPARPRTPSPRRSAAWTRARAGSSSTRASDEFALPAPGRSSEIVALADERRMPVLFHAGRGHPAPRRGGRRPRARATPAPGSSSPTRGSATSAGSPATPPSCRTSSSTPRGGSLRPCCQLYATRPARPDPLRERHALRPGPDDRVHLPARRARGRARRRRDARRSPAASSSADHGGGGPAATSVPRRAAPRSGRASSTPSASSPTAPPRCSCRFRGGRPDRVDRARPARVPDRPRRRHRPAPHRTSTGCSRSRSRTCATSRRRPARRRPRCCSR